MKLSKYDLITLGTQTGFLSLIGYLVLAFLKKCSSKFEKIELSDESRILEKYLSKSALYRVWKEFKVLDFYCSIILPIMFAFWYMLNYLTHTFDYDPFEVSILQLIKR